MSEETRELREPALALDPMDPNPETALPNHAPGAILAEMAGDALERGKESAGKMAAPAGLALSTTACGAEDIARLSQRPDEGGWAYFFRLILENPGSVTAITLIAAVALFGVRNTLRAVGSGIADGAKATGRFLIAANERGPQNQIFPDSLQNILAGFDENNTPALSMMQHAGRQRIVALERDLRSLFTTLRFDDHGSGTALYENIVRLAYAHGHLQEIGDGTFAMPGAPAAAPVPGPHRAPRGGHAPAAAPAAGRTLAQRRDDLLTEYDTLWQALAANNLTVTAAEGFETPLQTLIETIAQTYVLNNAERAGLRQAITIFLNSAPYYRSSVENSGALTDRHRRLLTGEVKRSVMTQPRARAATVLALFPGGAPGHMDPMADQVDHGRADTVDRVATVIDGNVPPRRRVRDTILRGGATGRGGLVPRGTRRGYVVGASARSFALGGGAWAALQLAGMAVGAGEPVPVKPNSLTPSGIHGPSSPEAAKVRGDAADSAKADTEAARARVEADASMNTHIKASLLTLYTILETGKDEFGNPLSDSERKENEGVIADFETAYKERGATDEDIAKLKAEAKAAAKSTRLETKPDANAEVNGDMERLKTVVKALLTNKQIEKDGALSRDEIRALNEEKRRLIQRLRLTDEQFEKIIEEVRTSLQ